MKITNMLSFTIGSYVCWIPERQVNAGYGKTPLEAALNFSNRELSNGERKLVEEHIHELQLGANQMIGTHEDQ